MESEVCVGGILFRDNKILLGKRSPTRQFYPDVWDIFGGHRKHNESLEQTLSRELKEEINVTPTKFTHIAVLHGPLPGIDREYELHVYLVSGWMGSPKNLAPSEHSQLAWFDVDEACTLHLAHSGYPELFGCLKDQRKEGDAGHTSKP